MPVTPEWKQSLLEALDDLGKDKKWLADEIGCSPSAITTLLKAKTKNSRLVIPICDALGLYHPEYQDYTDQKFVQAARKLRALDAKAFDRHYARITQRLQELER